MHVPGGMHWRGALQAANDQCITVKRGVFGPGGHFVPKIKISFDRFGVPYLFALMSYFVCDMTDVVYV